MYSETLLLFLNTLLYLIIHNLKIRRPADERLKKVVNALFGALIFLYFVLIYGQPLWHSKPLMYVDIFLIGLCVIVLIFQLKRNFPELSELIRKVFKTGRSIAESIFLSALLLINYVYMPSWTISLLILLIFLVKEIYVMSDFKKRYE